MNRFHACHARLLRNELMLSCQIYLIGCITKFTMYDMRSRLLPRCLSHWHPVTVCEFPALFNLTNFPEFLSLVVARCYSTSPFIDLQASTLFLSFFSKPRCVFFIVSTFQSKRARACSYHPMIRIHSPSPSPCSLCPSFRAPQYFPFHLIPSTEAVSQKASC